MNYYQQAIGPRKLHLYFQDGHSRVEITDFDKRTVLYVVYRNSSKPHLTLCEASMKGESDRFIGQISYHHFKSKIDMHYARSPINMEKAGFMSSDFQVNGPGIQWAWERDGAMTSNLELVDEHGSVMAQFESSTWSKDKLGKITIHKWPPAQDVLDIILLTGMAKIEYQRRDKKSTAAAVAVSS